MTQINVSEMLKSVLVKEAWPLGVSILVEEVWPLGVAELVKKAWPLCVCQS